MADSSKNASGVWHWLAHSKLIQALGGIAAAIAVPAFVLSLPPVQNRLFDSKASIEISLNSEVSIFDVKQPLSNLNVVFNGTDLTASKRSLVSAKIRITNVGDRSLTPSDVSSSDPLGFTVEGGQILRLTRSRASSDHLRRLAKPSLRGNSVILNAGLIFDSGDYVESDLLIVKPNGSKLTYRPMGKVSRQESIPFLDRRLADAEEGFLKKAFGGKWYVQISRGIFYAVVLFIVIACIAFIVAQIQKYLLSRRRKAIVSVSQEAYEHLSYHNPIALAYSIGLFGAVGYKPTVAQFNIMRREYTVSDSLTLFTDQADTGDEMVHAKPSEIREYLSRPYSATPHSATQLAREFGLLDYKSVSSELISTLEDLLSFLESKDRIHHLLVLNNYSYVRFDEEFYFAERERSRLRSQKRKERRATQKPAEGKM